MQKYDEHGKNDMGPYYLVSDVEGNISDLIAAKNGRIAGLEAAVKEKDVETEKYRKKASAWQSNCEEGNRQIAAKDDRIKNLADYSEAFHEAEERIAALKDETTKLRAFWEWSQRADRMIFEQDWKAEQGKRDMNTNGTKV